MCKKSDSISKLAMSLVKAQSEISPVGKDGNNPHFKSRYATLDNIIDETRPILAKHGLAIIQMPGGDGEHVKMVTMIMHESGEWMETEPLIMKPVKSDPQGVGSCITYARRYSYSALLSISTDEDDDGNASSNPKPVQGSYNNANQTRTNNTNQRTEPQQTPPTQSSQQPNSSGSTEVVKKPTDPQLKRIFAIAGEKGIKSPDVKEIMLAKFQIESTKDLNKKQYDELINYLEKA